MNVSFRLNRGQDGKGRVVWSAVYDTFGKATVDPASSLENPLRFPGQFHDPETGLHYNFHRYYSPATGRYITVDPIGLKGGLNLYMYVQNNPVKFVDPLGLWWEYSQSTGNLRHHPSPFEVTDVGTGYSGNDEGLNNPAMQNEPFVGPIPQGFYDIGPQRDSPNTGPGVMDLTPWESTDTFGRDNFQIHGDNSCGCNSASQGCIVLGRQIRNRIANSGDTLLRVIE